MDADTAKQTLMGTLNEPQRKIVRAFNGTQASRADIAERSGYSQHRVDTAISSRLYRASALSFTHQPAWSIWRIG